MLNVATGHKTTIPFVPVSDFQHVLQEQNDAITKFHASGTRQRKITLLIAHHYIQSLNENENTPGNFALTIIFLLSQSN